MKATKSNQPSKSKKPHTAWMRLLSAIAAILLLFGAGFFGVSVIVSDAEFIEDQYTALGTSEEMGVSVPDLSKATMALFDYMRGNRADIRVSVLMNGQQVDDLFYHPKEIVHMEEVRSLWRMLTALAILSIFAAFVLLAVVVFFGIRNTRLRATGTGLLIGTVIFTGVMAAAVLWAISDFNSFWTVFHFIIFPHSLIQYVSNGMTVEAYNNLNWVFEPDFAMIRMLDSLFPPLVMRAGIVFGVEILVLTAIGILLYMRGKRLDQVGSDIVEVRPLEPEERYVSVEDAPDLVLQHKLQNASLKQKMRLMEELRRDPEEEPIRENQPASTNTETDSSERPKDVPEPLDELATVSMNAQKMAEADAEASEGTAEPDAAWAESTSNESEKENANDLF